MIWGEGDIGGLEKGNSKTHPMVVNVKLKVEIH